MPPRTTRPNRQLSWPIIISGIVALFCLPATQTLLSRFNIYSDILNSLLVRRTTAYSTAGEYSVERAAHAFASYRRHAIEELQYMKDSFLQLDKKSQQFARDVGYASKLELMSEIIQTNSLLTDHLATVARTEHGYNDLRLEDSSSDFGRVIETLKHFVRDWTSEGSQERDIMFRPILDILMEIEEEERAEMNVLIPGAGLARLAWEISELGYNTTASELSSYMTVSLSHLLSITSPNSQTLYPYAHIWSHQRSTNNTFRAITYPDAVPRSSSNFHIAPSDFFLSREKYDVIVTLFFIDTSPNVVRMLRKIYSLLTPGGIWINFGPLVWPSTSYLQLSLEELLKLAQDVGFQVDEDNLQTIPTSYNVDALALLKFEYQAQFWVARKTEDAL